MKHFVVAATELLGISLASSGFWANMDHIRTVILFFLGVIFLGLGIVSRYLDVRKKNLDIDKERIELKRLLKHQDDD